jgi:hypothetical protein
MGGVLKETITVQPLEVMFDPSVDAAVMDAVPAFTPVMTPAELTKATLVSVECQVRVLLVALAGATAAVRLVVLPTVTDAVEGIEMPVTATEAGGVFGGLELSFPPQAMARRRPSPHTKAEHSEPKIVGFLSTNPPLNVLLNQTEAKALIKSPAISFRPAQG